MNRTQRSIIEKSLYGRQSNTTINQSQFDFVTANNDSDLNKNSQAESQNKNKAKNVSQYFKQDIDSNALKEAQNKHGLQKMNSRLTHETIES